MRQRFPWFALNSDSDDEDKSPSRNRVSRTTKIKIGAISCCVLTAGVTTIIVTLATRKSHHKESSPVTPTTAPPPYIGTSKLSFDFDPQKGFGNITIHNVGDADVEVIAIKFVTNAIITSSQGELAPEGSQLTTIGTEGTSITYQLSTPPQSQIIIEANTSKSLGYCYQKTLGPINVGAVPKNIIVSAVDNTYQVPLADQCEGTACDDPFPGRVVGGYYNEHDMYEPQFTVKNINPAKLNHIYYGPIGCDVYGNIQLVDENVDSIQIPTLTLLRQQFPYLKVSLSIGGESASATFPSLAKNATARDILSKNALSLLDQYNLTGIEIDWYYPKQIDGNNLVQLLKNMRETMDQNGQRYELSFAGEARPDRINLLGYRIHDFEQYIDQLNIKAYNYNGPSTSDYQSPMNLPSVDPNGQSNSINSTISLYTHYLLPNQKMVLQIPSFYSGDKVSSLSNDGIWQAIIGKPEGQYNEVGKYDYACVIAHECYGGKTLPSNCQYLNTEQAFFGNYSKTPLIKCPDDPSVFTGESISSAAYKTSYAIQQNLKGVLISSLSGDARNDENLSLLHTIDETIKTHNAAKSLPTITEIKNENDWQEFIKSFEGSFTHSFLSGAFYVCLFSIVAKITNKILEKIINKDSESLYENTAIYYSVKFIIYLTTLYFIGVPILPTLAGKFIGEGLSGLLGLQDKESLAVGTLTSFLINMSTKPELHTPAGIANETVKFLVSFSGGLTYTLVSDNFSALTKFAGLKSPLWRRRFNNFGFFSTNESPHEQAETEQTRVYEI